MNHTISAFLRKSLFATAVNVYIAIIFLILLRFGIRLAGGDDGWTIGDWLINYHAGFVRRGGMGEILLALAQVFHMRAQWLTLILQMSCYFCIALVFRKLVLDSERSPWIVALLISPATLAFPLFDIFSGYRKEILFLATLAIFVYWLVYRRASDISLSIYLCLVLPIIILSHEAIFFYIPYYLGALLIALGDYRRAIAIFVLPLAFSCGALYLVLGHPGNLTIAQGVCRSVGFVWQGKYIGPCGFAIFSLSVTPNVAHNDLLLHLRACPTYKLYPILGLLSLFPLFVGFVHLRRLPSSRPRVHALAAIFFLSASLSIGLFYYALDWGRLIYMHVMAAALLTLMIECLARRERLDSITICNSVRPMSFQEDRTLPSEVRYGFNVNFRNAVAWLLIAIYASCWNLTPSPDIGYRSPPFGLIGIVHELHSKDVKKAFLGPLAS
jgi:hypothetical protein